MKSTYFTALVVSSLLTVGTVAAFPNAPQASANPCAAAEVNPCAANPCAANPCAANPCAANPCAANPCAANPCAANPCAANPCAAATTPTTTATPSGTFQAAAHDTLGTAAVIEENGKRYLQFDEAFRSDNGPDLFVLLHKQATPQSYSSEQFVNLGRLQSVEGTQRYEIPEGVSVEDFQSAVVWCRQFNVTFGFATF